MKLGQALDLAIQIASALAASQSAGALQISRCAVCFRFHKIEERLARWLLMSADRMESNEFLMTQKTLSHMLGVRREGVTKAASHLQKLGVIQYSRGRIRILDRPALETASCDCYSILLTLGH